MRSPARARQRRFRKRAPAAPCGASRLRRSTASRAISLCPDDAFTTSGLFDNGTYQDTRLNYGGDLNQGDVSNSLLLLILTQSQTFPNPSTASGFTFRIGGVVPVRESDLYGPLFGERALTNGKKQLSVTFNINQLRFRSIDGSSVRNGQRGLLWGDTNYDSNGGGYVGICRMDINTTIGVCRGELRSAGRPRRQRRRSGRAHERRRFERVPGLPSSRMGRSFRRRADRCSPLRLRAATSSRGRRPGSGTSRSVRNTPSSAGSDAGAAVTVRTSLPTGSLDDMTGTGRVPDGRRLHRIVRERRASRRISTSRTSLRAASSSMS